MASTPRVSLDDSYILGVTCAICGADALSVNHVPNLPDYVTCAECSSAFLVEEGGDRVFYGQVAAGYEETERFALKQWAWIEAVETRAREERPRPEGEAPTFPDPERIEEAEGGEPEGESLSAEEWISSEIPHEDLQAAASEEGIDLQAESSVASTLDAFEPELDSVEELSSLSPFEAEEQATPIPELGSDEEEGLADFFEALTDDTGEVAPIVEPDEFLVSEKSPDLEAFDADIERLLKTEEDTGPDLPPPPWAAESTEDAPAEGLETPAEEEPTWESFFDAESGVEDDAVPVVDAKEETYESLPAWQSLEDATPLSQDEQESEPPAWAAAADDDATDFSESWGELEKVGSLKSDDASPETPEWAIPSDDEPAGSSSQFTGPDELSWGTEPVEESTPGWQEIPGMFSKDDAGDDDDFISGLRRSAAVPLESQPVDDQPLSDIDDEADAPWGMGSDDIAARMESISQPVEQPEPIAAGWEMTAAAAEVSAAPDPEPEITPAPILDLEDEVYMPPPTDPPPGQRHRVVIRGERVIFPAGECAHCGRTPARSKLAVAGTLPRGQAVGQRKPTRFEVPLCADCRKRAASKSEDASAAQLQAHLISGIVGMVLVVGALATDLIDPRDLSIVDLFLGLILFIVGYGGPAFFLLNRVGNYLPPVDARYIRTTLLVPSETQGLETAFEWRNSEYAQHFHGANSANALGNVTGVKDRIA
jgi:hypothetical protein